MATVLLRFLAPRSVDGNICRALWTVLAAGQGLLLWAIGLNWWQVVVVVFTGRFFVGAMSELERK